MQAGYDRREGASQVGFFKKQKLSQSQAQKLFLGVKLLKGNRQIGEIRQEMLSEHNIAVANSLHARRGGLQLILEDSPWRTQGPAGPPCSALARGYPSTAWPRSESWIQQVKLSANLPPHKRAMSSFFKESQTSLSNRHRCTDPKQGLGTSSPNT